MAHFVTIRLVVPLPLVVNGGKTLWRLYVDHYGKNGNKAAVIARCISDPTREPILLEDGREGRVCGAPYAGLRVRRGSIECKILSKLVRTGKAVVVPDFDDNDPFAFIYGPRHSNRLS